MCKMNDGWTDERMDDFRDEVYRRFDGVDQRFHRFEGDVNRRFDEVDKRFDKLDGRFDKLDGRFDKLEERFGATHRLMTQAAIGIAGLVLAGYAALAALIAVLA